MSGRGMRGGRGGRGRGMKSFLEAGHMRGPRMFGPPGGYGYGDDYYGSPFGGYGGKRRMDDFDPMAHKRQRMMMMHDGPRGRRGWRGGGPPIDPYSRRGREGGFNRWGRGAMAYGPPMPMYDHFDAPPMMPMDGPPQPDHTISIEGKLNNFIAALFKYEDLSSPIQAIETSRHENTSTVKIRTDYRVFEEEDEELCIDGHLKINGVLLAREQGKCKHTVKEAVYTKALYMLLTKSVSEIFANSNKLYADLPESQRKLKAEITDGKTKHRDHKFITVRLKELVDILREGLPPGYNFKDNFVREVDVVCGTVDAGITLVYKKLSDERIVCDLYVDDLMIGSGEDKDKKGAMKNAYQDTKRILANWKRSTDKIVNEGKHLQDVEFMDPELYDLHYKAKNHERGSNLYLLKTSNCAEQFATDIKARSPPINKWMVTYEHEADSSNMSYKVLEDNSRANRVLLEYAIYCGHEGGRNRCVIFLCGQLIADAVGHNKVRAKANASQKGIKYLREHCTLIKTRPRDYKNPALNFEQAKEKALLLKADSPELARDWDLSSYPAPAPNDPQPDDLSPWVDQVLENLLIEYSKTQNLEEIVLEKDFPRYHTLRLKDLAKKYGVHVIIKTDKHGNSVIIQRDVFNSPDPNEIVKILKENGNASGRLTLAQYVDENGEVVKCIPFEVKI